MVVPQQLREELSSMLVLDDISDSSYPKLMVESYELVGKHVVISVVVEGEVVCSSGDLLTAFALLATNYIFNIAYPDVLQNNFLVYKMD